MVGAEAAKAMIAGGSGRGADGTGVKKGRRARVRKSEGGGSGFSSGIGDSRNVTANIRFNWLLTLAAAFGT